jgi:hypothetical protein
MNRDDLQRLSKDDLIELVLRLQRPDKTSRTSSKPPSTDRKERREQAKPGGAKPGHEGHSRKLCETPDAVEDHEPTHCPNCLGAFGADAEPEFNGVDGSALSWAAAERQSYPINKFRLEIALERRRRVFAFDDDKIIVLPLLARC